MKKRMVISCIVVLVLLLLLFGSYKLMNSRAFQLFGGITSQVETNEKIVALTFDDGPTNHVNQIVSILDQYNAKATFFLIGNELQKSSEEGRKIAEAGHQIGNHTYSHERMIFKTPSFIKQEIEKTNNLIRETGFKGEIDFRPPNGKKLIGLPYYLNKKQIDTITWNLEPDSYYTSVDDKVAYVNENIEPGSIILLHPMHDDTGKELRVIEGILKSLTEKGYQFVTVNELQK
ncbi:peptidoglycan/xylan/chitin deacetylase (PgdA/CDA1 family) [Bacillus pakistanensis]|uniref:Peptidoglycan/xylan/chitin deacetylase (PgdA/CDA1 family) n=1 Tax=Rossellomorea pakistanensis TaxID=992288 RepID=A0ABS2N6U8_9BACI|nr:polysaccharide deacetylase family protein [Bacillus pakistanensis]MBM7583530.1 peptidoglycan/xylan/chitin deacetylase (PgdA/CDA1 family) [Bacillus pakistanensis]